MEQTCLLGKSIYFHSLSIFYVLETFKFSELNILKHLRKTSGLINSVLLFSVLLDVFEPIKQSNTSLLAFPMSHNPLFL